MAETGDYARKLQLADVLREPVIRTALRDLCLNHGDRVLDVGCGIGSHLAMLALLVGDSGSVTGLDISPEMISRARRAVFNRGLEDRVSLVEGDVNSLPFEEGAFECVVSVDCAGYPYSSNPAGLLRELSRVVQTGGTVALLGWTYQQLLPGYPLLESRLNTDSTLTVPAGTCSSPESHFLRAPGWFREAGFTDITARTYAGDIFAPLSEEGKEAVHAFFEMLWENPRSSITNDEWPLFVSITKRGSGECILDRDDYYGFFVYTCFSGRVASILRQS